MTGRSLILGLGVALAISSVSATASADKRSRRRARTAVQPNRHGHADRLGRKVLAAARGPRAELSRAIRKVWAGPLLRQGVTAVYVVDAHTGELIYAVHPDDKLNPASNVKLISTAAVLDTLGPDWKYETRMFGAAPGPDKVSRGDLYLRGNADPTFGTTRLREMVDALAASGVTRIEGDVVLGADALRDTLGVPRVVVKVTAPAEVGQPPVVEVSPVLDFIKVEVAATTVPEKARRARLEVKSRLDEPVGAPAQMVITVVGKIRAGKAYSYRKGVGKRSTFTGHVVRQFLREAGVVLTGQVKIEEFDAYVARADQAGYLPVELVRSESKPMGELVRTVNKRSLNYLADRLIMTAGAVRHGGKPTIQKGVAVMRDWLDTAGVDPRNLVIDTGSGLSRQTQLTTRQLVKVLRVGLGYQPHKQAAAPCETSHLYLESLAVAGVDGTLRSRYKNTEAVGNVFGKTGTLTGVVALSGVVSAGDDNALAFSIVTNGNDHKLRQQIRRQHDAMVRAMHRFLTVRAARREQAAQRDQAAVAAKAAAAQAKADALAAAGAGDETDAAEEEASEGTPGAEAAGADEATGEGGDDEGAASAEDR